jgi:predicted O-methyltransferase YrrM
MPMREQQSMGQETWSAVDAYLTHRLVGSDAALEAAVAASRAAGLPDIQISPTQGKLLMLLTRAMGAHFVLELGTLGGYSTIWLARGLPADGKLVTCELNPKHAAVARTNIERAGLSANVDLRVGPALGTLADLLRERHPSFDLVFIDADKPNYPAYLAAVLELCRPGTLIVADNVVRGGDVIDEATSDSGARGVRRFVDFLAADSRVSATAIQTVGEKGYDGFALALVTHPR